MAVALDSVDFNFADFACVAWKLVIEVDGEHHALQLEADSRRTDFMEQAGWHVIRFNASEAVQNPDGVWTEITRVLGIEK